MTPIPRSPVRCQRKGLALFGFSIAVAVGAVVDWPTTASVVLAIAATCFIASALDRAYLAFLSIAHRTRAQTSATDLHPVTDKELPVYTVLIPAFGTPPSSEAVRAAVGRLDYPPDKLDIRLIIDQSTWATAPFEPNLDHYVNTPVMPHTPAHKNASTCDGAKLQPGMRGAYVTVMKVGDHTDPLQLRKAVSAFANAPENTGALQGKLRYYNSDENLLTRWLSIERDTWSSYLMPASSRLGCVVPLSGSAIHIRMTALNEVGGWDCSDGVSGVDLGIRFARNGYRTLMLDSATETAATTLLLAWARRRSHWYLRSIQSIAVHTRHPIQLYRDLGAVTILRLINLTTGWPLWCVLNIGFWMLAVSGLPDITVPSNSFFDSSVWQLCVPIFLAGNIVAFATGLIAGHRSGQRRWLSAALLIPGYWLMQGVAAIAGVFQLGNERCPPRDMPQRLTGGNTS